MWGNSVGKWKYSANEKDYLSAYYDSRWMDTPTIRFMSNYIIADSDNPKFNDPDIFQLRGQIDF